MYFCIGYPSLISLLDDYINFDVSFGIHFIIFFYLITKHKNILETLPPFTGCNQGKMMIPKFQSLYSNAIKTV